MDIFDLTVIDQKQGRILRDIDRHGNEIVGSLFSLSDQCVESPKVQMEQERKIRREIANSNERRRMQSINAGFQSLRALLPHNEGEKLSKAAILQQTTQYIYQIEQEKTRLLSHNSQLKRLLNQQNQDSDASSSSESPLPKRKKIDPDAVASEEEVAISNLSPDELKGQVAELRQQLDRERRCRLILQAQSRSYDAQLYQESAREIPSQQLQTANYHSPKSVKSDLEPKEERAERAEDSSDEHVGQQQLVSVAVPAVVTRRLSQEGVAPTPLLFRRRSGSSGAVNLEGGLDDGDDTDMVDEDTDDETETSERAVALLAHVGGVTVFQSQPSPQQPHSPHAAAQVVPRSVSPHQQQQSRSSYLASTSRQNLETIVEAIRHLEGDHLFDDPSPTKDKLKHVVTALALEEAEVEGHCRNDDDDGDSSPPHASVPVASALEHHHHLAGGFRHHQHHPSSGHHSYHHRVIQSSSTGQTQSRPGVIVSVHS